MGAVGGRQPHTHSEGDPGKHWHRVASGGRGVWAAACAAISASVKSGGALALKLAARRVAARVWYVDGGSGGGAGIWAGADGAGGAEAAVGMVRAPHTAHVWGGRT